MFKPAPPIKVEDILLYLPNYGVIICKICQYAVQPTALSGHLLNHQVYRIERRKLLDEISTLTLYQPEDVPFPPYNSVALPDLPVYKGYRCNASGCSRAFVSQKRMNQHWSESHQECSSVDVDCRPTHLQTFFKGNKIRYFEVIPPSGRAISQPTSNESLTHRRVSSTPLFMEGISHHQEIITDLTSLDYISESPFGHLDMSTLELLHHYTTSTSHTISRGVESVFFWAQDIPIIAFGNKFLMYGILSIAAFHCSSMPCEPSKALSYQQKALQFQSAGLPGFRAAMADPTTENSTAIIAFAWLLGIQRCVGALNLNGVRAAATSDSKSMSPIIEFLMLMRGGCDMVLKFQHLLPVNSDFRILGVVIEELLGSHDDSSSPDGLADSQLLQYPGVPLAVCQRLIGLPTALKDALPSFEDSEIVSPAVLCLLKSYARSYASDNGLALWNGIEAWVLQISDEFLGLLKAGHPAALVVFAHWCVLMRRTESHYWFLKGQSARLIGIVESHLEGNISNLISDLSP